MKAIVSFAFGFGAGMVFLAAAMWGTGSFAPRAREPVRFLGARVLRPGEPPPVLGAVPPDPGPFATPPIPAVVSVPTSLRMPIAGVNPQTLLNNFAQERDGHAHEALDIMAARGTPVMATAEGNVVKLFTSKQGGLTVYQFDDSQTWCYYYAHLDRYAPGLKEGTLLRTGEVLGYVGSTGNASPDAPHLHFAIFRLGPEKHWWEGTAVDPLPLLK